jgi:hypothetical protein
MVRSCQRSASMEALLAFRAATALRGAERRPTVVTAAQAATAEPVVVHLPEHVSSVVTLHAPPRVVMAPSGQASCNCPEWHALRVFGHGRHRVSFEAGDDGLVSAEVDSVCAVCGYGLRTTTGALAPDVAGRA